jgi:hypothetical protein
MADDLKWPSKGRSRDFSLLSNLKASTILSAPRGTAAGRANHVAREGGGHHATNDWAAHPYLVTPLYQ